MQGKAKTDLPYDLLEKITDRAFWLALQMIRVANHRKEKERGEPKVGGHPSACASSKHILAAIHLVLREPADYFAFKPHISPMDHAFNYLLTTMRQPDGSWMSDDLMKKAMHHLRHFSPEGVPVFQSYHADSDPDSFRYFPSGSVGIPPVNALYLKLGYSFAQDHRVRMEEDPVFWCLMGDSESREGSLAEAMPDAGERELGRLIWIVDYNRQNLDGTRVSNEKALGGSDADRMVKIAEANGWNAIKLKHGGLRETAFGLPGGEEFRQVLDTAFTDFEMQALIASKNPKLTREVLDSKSKSLKKYLKQFSDEELQGLFLNLGGHDLKSLVQTLKSSIQIPRRPTLIVAYTIKGHGLRCEALSGNHSAIPEDDELNEFGERMGASMNDPFARPPGEEERYLSKRSSYLKNGISQVAEKVTRRKEAYSAKFKNIIWPVDFGITALKFNPVAHTQWMWGQIAAKLDRLARSDGQDETLTPEEKQWHKIAPFFLTMAPDVGSSTNTSPNMNGKLYGLTEQEDFEKKFDAKDERAPDVVPHIDVRTGHLRFEIAEGNCMSAAGSFGKMHDLTGVPYFPAMTIYDFFIKRAHDQLYYNLYWHSSFLLVGTPSGITLAPEGAQHSWKSDFQIPNSVTWEPCFAKEVEWILSDAIRRHFCSDDADREGVILRCVTKGISQRELTDRARKQLAFQRLSEDEILSQIRGATLKGGYPLVNYSGFEDYAPGDNVVHLFAMGALVPEALRASDELLKNGIYANVFVVTSPDLLLGNFAYQDHYEHLRVGLKLAETKARIPIVSVHDGEPGLLDNIGSILGTHQKALAVRKTSKSGTTWDIFEYHGLNAAKIVASAHEILETTAAQESTPMTLART